MRRPAITALALFAGSLVFFLVRVGAPPSYSLDETFYVPAARDFLHWTANSNRFNPPLAKYLIALGMRLWGDTPLGWRFLSAVFGALTVVAMYAWGLALFRRQNLAVWAALLALTNQYLYVMARTAMLDVFMFGFMAWGMAAFCAAWRRDLPAPRTRALLLFAGVMFGLATACKWLGVVAGGVAFALAAALLLARGVRMPSSAAFAAGEREESWYTPEIFRGIGWGTVLLAFVAAPAGAYCVTLVPLLFLPGASLNQVIADQLYIWTQHTTFHGAPVQTGAWWAFPVTTRPLMFYLQVAPDRLFARTVTLSGNPLVMWTGLLALAWCAWEWLARASRPAFLIVLWYAALYLCWAVIPLHFFYRYYHFPAATVLSLALAYFPYRYPRARFLGLSAHWVFLAAAALVFALMLPFSSAMRIPLEWLP